MGIHRAYFTAWLAGTASLSCLLLAHFLAQAQDAARAPVTKKDAPDEKTIRALIAELGDESFERRAAAQKRLSDIGLPAEKLLAKAVRDSTDAEIRLRATQLLASITRAQLITLKTGAQVLSVAFSPDSKTFASGGFDNVVTLWEVTSGKKQHTLEGHSNVVHSVAYSPDGRTIASGSWDKTVRLWDVATLKEKTTLKGHIERVQAIAFAQDGKSLATCDGRSAKVWDLATGKEKLTVQEGGGFMRAVALGYGGKTLATSGIGQAVNLWSTSTGELTMTLIATEPRIDEEANVYALAYSKDGRTLAVSTGELALGRGRGVVRLWEIATGLERTAFLQTGNERDALAIALSVKGTTLATGHVGGTVTLWDLATGNQRVSFVGHHGEVVHGVTFDNAGKLFASAGSGTITLWSFFEPGPDRQVAKSLTPEVISGLWDDLASADGTKAYKALFLLAQVPTQTVSFLQRQLCPALAPNPEKVQQLVMDLGNEQFSVRNNATLQLETLAEVVEGVLRNAITKNPPLEAQQRIGALLSKLKGPVTSPKKMQIVRAVEVLELIGSPEAQRVLESLAGGAPGARETEEAKASLERVKLREGVP
jgi:WD40 repeat protein